MNQINPLIETRLLKPVVTIAAIAVLVMTIGTTVASSGSAAAATSPLAEGNAQCEQGMQARSSKKTRSETPRKTKKTSKRAKRGKKTITGIINLNTATAGDLTKLPGVGPAKAGRIVSYRGKHGAFKRVKDLRRVKGFGYKSLKKLAKYLAVKGKTTIAVASVPVAAK